MPAPAKIANTPLAMVPKAVHLPQSSESIIELPDGGLFEVLGITRGDPGEVWGMDGGVLSAEESQHVLAMFRDFGVALVAGEVSVLLRADESNTVGVEFPIDLLGGFAGYRWQSPVGDDGKHYHFISGKVTTAQQPGRIKYKLVPKDFVPLHVAAITIGGGQENGVSWNLKPPSFGLNLLLQRNYTPEEIELTVPQELAGCILLGKPDRQFKSGSSLDASDWMHPKSFVPGSGNDSHVRLATFSDDWKDGYAFHLYAISPVYIDLYPIPLEPKVTR